MPVANVHRRLGREEWLRQFFHLPIKPVAKKPVGKKLRKQPRRWLVRLGGLHCVVLAHTRSEARSLAKRHFKVATLPGNATIVKLVGSQG